MYDFLYTIASATCSPCFPRFRFSNLEQIDDRYPNRDQYNFPPLGTTCYGSGAERLTVTESWLRAPRYHFHKQVQKTKTA